MSMKQWHGEGPADGGSAGLKACQEEVIAVTPWPGAQTSYLRGPENPRYATGMKSTFRIEFNELNRRVNIKSMKSTFKICSLKILS